MAMKEPIVMSEPLVLMNKAEVASFAPTKH